MGQSDKLSKTQKVTYKNSSLTIRCTCKYHIQVGKSIETSKQTDEVATSHIEESKSSNARRQQEKDTKSMKQSDMMKTVKETLNTNVEQKTDATGKPENIQEAKVNFMITFLHAF